VKTLKAVGRQCNLLNPDEFKTYLTTANYSENRRDKILGDMARFYKFLGVKFEKPLSRRVETLPFLPLENEIDALIGGLGKKLSAFTRLVKETGARPVEIWQLRWTDIDTEASTVDIRPEKGSRPRRPKITANTLASVIRLRRESLYIFHSDKVDIEESYRNFFRNFAKQRRKIADRLQNPRIRRISFKTLRHWKASTLYAKTKDLLLVKETLGHRSISSTMKYTHMMPLRDDEYVCKVARTVEEARTLVEDGFDYVTEVDSMKLFRKRK
jgi:integrase